MTLCTKGNFIIVKAICTWDCWGPLFAIIGSTMVPSIWTISPENSVIDASTFFSYSGKMFILRGNHKIRHYWTSIINKHVVYIVVNYVQSHNHGVVVWVLHFLDVSLGEGDDFFDSLSFVRVGLLYQPCNYSIDIPSCKAVSHLLYAQRWLW